MISTSRSNKNNNQTRREICATSIKPHREVQNSKTLQLKVQRLENKLSLLKQKISQGGTENISFKGHLLPVHHHYHQNNFNTYQNRKKLTYHICQQQRRRKNFNNPKSKISLPNNGNINVYEKKLKGQINTGLTLLEM